MGIRASVTLLGLGRYGVNLGRVPFGWYFLTGGVTLTKIGMILFNLPMISDGTIIGG